ncbi:hypothetical protein [Erwinia billingiae]|uniref:hypothetical protein n=1 Tax=Erwinia billingiae TaxID=182337 RepID=UPI0022475A27|nr:hypothetical protein [Erwinia billingiae]MCX0499935.1 hypothetical protein [Erwinia billingiae]
MKLTNPVKNNQSVNFYTLITLMIRCIICIFFMAMVGCLLGRLIVFFRANVLFFDWGKDIFYSLKVGASAGTLAGISIWIKARLQERKDEKSSIK